MNVFSCFRVLLVVLALRTCCFCEYLSSHGMNPSSIPRWYIVHIYLNCYLIFLQLQELATQLIDLWNLMDTPREERCLFDHVTCNISASVDEVTIPGALASDLIEQVP